MNKTKVFKQYSDDYIFINVSISLNGTFRAKSHIHYKQSEREIMNKYRNTEHGKNILRKCSFKHSKTEKRKISNKKYIQSDKGKLALRRREYKRRGLGFYPLNNWFLNSEGHHIDYENIIFIPKELHKSISHNLSTNKNMHEINNLAIDYYYKEKEYRNEN